MGSNNDQNFRGGHFSEFLKMPVLGINSGTNPPQILGSIGLDRDSTTPYYSIQTAWVPFCSCSSSFGQFQSDVGSSQSVNEGDVVILSDIEVAQPSSDYTLNSGGVIITTPGWYQIWYQVSMDLPAEFVI